MKNIADPFTKGVNPFDELDDFYRTQGDAKSNKDTVDWAESDKARMRIANRQMDWLSRHPILAKYIQHIEGSASLNTLPEHAIGERLYAMMTLVLAACGDIEILTTAFARSPADYDRTLFFQRAATGASVLIAKAQIYLWSDRTEKLADASPLPTHTVSREVLPSPLMFWSRETRYNFKDQDGRTASNNWVFLMHQVDHVSIVADVSYHDVEATKLVFDAIDYGGVWPSQYNNDRHMGQILKRCAFLASPFVMTDRRRMTHVVRRQLERDHGMTREATNEPECHVVQLRRLVASPKKRVGEPRGVEWKHHWWVDAHYRAQWYPSEQAHKVIWIAPHIKGDLSKPLLEKVYAVVR